MALFQCIQVSKATTPGQKRGGSGIWRSRAFRGLTPKSSRARSRCDAGVSKCHLWLQRPLKQKKATLAMELSFSISVLTRRRNPWLRGAYHHKMPFNT